MKSEVIYQNVSKWDTFKSEKGHNPCKMHNRVMVLVLQILCEVTGKYFKFQINPLKITRVMNQNVSKWDTF